jgi:small conductance mechanosensitive channel
MNVENIGATIGDLAVNVGAKVLGAIVLFIVGRWLIGLALSMTDRALNRQSIDKTLVRYIHSALGAILNIALIVALLGFFGVETTTFAALLAAGGVAIGLAWSGLLANFAAGAFIVVLRPFKVGDFIAAGGVTGTVNEIGLFVTVFTTPDNVRTIVGNNAIFGSNISNFSANAYRRVELKAQLAHGVDPVRAAALLKTRLASIDNVLTSPAPDVEILDFTLSGPVLAVRPYTHTDNYWQVYFDTNKAIKEEFTKAGFPVPEQHFNVAK